MKFTTASVIAVGLSAQALANPTIVQRQASKVQRDLAAFESVISAVDDAVKQFDTDVNSYSSGAPTTLLSDAASIVSITNSGVSTLKGEATLSDTDAVSLTSPVQALSSDVKTSIDDLVSKKSALVAAGAGGEVESGLQQQLTAAQSLGTVISDKVPSALSGIAGELSSGITSAIQSGIDAFKGTGSTATSSAASSATSSAASSGSSSSSGTSVSASGTTTATATSVATTTTSVAVGSSSAVASATSSGKGSATSSGVLPGSSSTSTGVTPQYTGAASTTKASGAVGLVAALLALFAL